MHASLRKRRRQQYHARKVLKAQKPNSKDRKAKRTKDGGAFDEPLKDPRRTITIAQKLEVIEAYEAYMEGKRKAKETLQEPKPLGDRSAQVAWLERRKAAKKVALSSALVKTKEQFPNVIQGAQLCKWLQACERENWRDLPQIVASRCSATSNSWRSKVTGLRKKGKNQGGSVPLALQVELDKLMADMSSGASSVSERKELVTTEHVASHQH